MSLPLWAANDHHAERAHDDSPRAVELSRPGREGRDLGMIVRRTVHSEELEDGGEHVLICTSGQSGRGFCRGELP